LFITQLFKTAQPILPGSIVSNFHSEVESGTGYLQYAQYEDIYCNVTSFVFDYVLNVCLQYEGLGSLLISNQQGSNIVNLTAFDYPNCTVPTMAQFIPISGTCISGSVLKIFDGTSTLPPSPFKTNYLSERFVQYLYIHLFIYLIA